MEKDNKALIERLRYLIEISRMSQAEFARRIDIDPSNLSKHLSGRLPIGDTLINRIVVETGVARRWLRDGIDTPFAKETTPPAIDFSHTSLIATSAPAVIGEDAGAPVYDIDVTAGCQELSRMFTRERLIGTVKLPGVNPESAIVRVSGDSMRPVIINGGYIVIRPFNDLKNIFWGQIYVVVMEDYRMVKFVRRHPDDRTKVILRSANPDYDDMEVERADIRSLYLVETILNYDIRC